MKAISDERNDVMSTTETPQEAVPGVPVRCGWCRDPGCDGDHSGDRAEPFVIDTAGTVPGEEPAP